MLAQITLQAALIPMALGLISVFACFRSSLIQKHFIHVLFLAWLFVYIWIVRVPDFPPKQATDYLCLIVLSFVFANLIFDGKRIQAFIQSSLFIVFSMLMLWTVLSYDASWASHWPIWLEFLALSSFVFLQACDRREYKGRMKGFLMATVLGLSSVLVIVSGSLLLGLIAASLASIAAIPCFFPRFSMDQVAIDSFQLLALSILVIARFYAGLPFIAFVLIIASFAIIRLLTFDRTLHFIVPLACMLAAIALVVSEELLTQESYY